MRRSVGRLHVELLIVCCSSACDDRTVAFCSVDGNALNRNTEELTVYAGFLAALVLTQPTDETPPGGPSAARSAWRLADASRTGCQSSFPRTAE